MTALRTGHHKLNVKGSDGTELTLRVHRGGYHRAGAAAAEVTANTQTGAISTAYGNVSSYDLANKSNNYQQNVFNNRSFKRSAHLSTKDPITTRNQLNIATNASRLTSSRSEYQCEMTASLKSSSRNSSAKKQSFARTDTASKEFTREATILENNEKLRNQVQRARLRRWRLRPRVELRSILQLVS